MANQRRVPVLVRSDSHLKTKRHPLKNAAKWPFYRSFIPRLDSCLPVGQWSRDYFLHYGADPRRVFVVPHSVDSCRLAQQASSLVSHRDELRHRWQISKDDIVWLFAGKFIEKKRPLDFVKAVLKASGSDRLCGLMVGDGPLRPMCESFARDHGAPIRT